jgi:AcrR family transcriptional regulator
VKRPVSRTTEAITSAALNAASETREQVRRRMKGTRKDGRSARWTEHRVARRMALIESAITAIREHGAGVGMDQIAAVAHTSKPVIYRYFADKADLHRAIVGRAAADLLDRLVVALESVTDPRETIAAGIDAFLGLLDDDPELYRFVVGHQSEAAGLVRDYVAGINAIITQRLADQLEAAGRDPRRATPGGAAIVGFIRAAADWWIDHPDEMSRDELTEYLTSLLWGGAAGVYTLAGVTVDNRLPEHLFPKIGSE